MFANWIYQDKELYLVRKFIEFEKEKQPLEFLKDRKNKQTKVALELRKQNFLHEYTKLLSIEKTCLNIGITKQTYNTWMTKDTDFKMIFDKTKQDS